MKKFSIIISAIFSIIVLLNLMAPLNCVRAYETSNECKSNIMIELNSNKILSEKNIDEKLPIASIVKLMTLDIVFDSIEKNIISEDSYMTVSEYAASMEGSQLFLDENSKHLVKDLIKSVVIVSANDSAVTLAENLYGTEENFVKEMNIRASKYLMNNTHFVDSTGLNENGYSTARDISILASRVLDNDLYKKYSKIWLDKYQHPSGRVTELVNTNKLIRKLDYCLSGKTGTTEKAGYCLASLCDNNGFKLLNVILGANTTDVRFTLAKNEFEKSYATYAYKTIYKKDECITTIDIKKSNNDKLDLKATKEYGVVYLKDKVPNIKVTFEIKKEYAPIKESDLIGYANIFDNDTLLYKIDLISNKNINKIKYSEIVKNLISNY